MNSYRRLQPQYWSSAYACWGPDNREATVRVPSTFWGDEAASTNLEFKPADASANPYLAFGALIGVSTGYGQIWGKIRNQPVGVALTAVISAAALYVCWAMWVPFV